MKKPFYIAKSVTSKLYISETGDIIKDLSKAKRFEHVGDCMRFCIDANENLGKASFKICEIYEDCA